MTERVTGKFRLILELARHPQQEFSTVLCAYSCLGELGLSDVLVWKDTRYILSMIPGTVGLEKASQVLRPLQT